MASHPHVLARELNPFDRFAAFYQSLDRPTFPRGSSTSPAVGEWAEKTPSAARCMGCSGDSMFQNARSRGASRSGVKGLPRVDGRMSLKSNPCNRLRSSTIRLRTVNSRLSPTLRVKGGTYGTSEVTSAQAAPPRRHPPSGGARGGRPVLRPGERGTRQARDIVVFPPAARPSLPCLRASATQAAARGGRQPPEAGGAAARSGAQVAGQPATVARDASRISARWAARSRSASGLSTRRS